MHATRLAGVTKPEFENASVCPACTCVHVCGVHVNVQTNVHTYTGVCSINRHLCIYMCSGINM